MAENPEGRIGLEQYAWTAGSSMSHGEHATDTADWIEMSQDIERAPLLAHFALVDWRVIAGPAQG